MELACCEVVEYANKHENEVLAQIAPWLVRQHIVPVHLRLIPASGVLLPQSLTKAFLSILHCPFRLKAKAPKIYFKKHKHEVHTK